MPRQRFRVPTGGADFALSLLFGVSFAVALFVGMALTQMLGDVNPPLHEIEETMVAFTPPDIVEMEQEEPPPPEQEEPQPELEIEPPQLSLAQLDIALNPGTGGSLAGDFEMPTIRSSQAALGTEDFVDFSNLDQVPRPIGAKPFRFPARLMKKKVSGTIVLLIELSKEGEVLGVDVESSDLRDFEPIVVSSVERWRFTPPTAQGRPVKTRARIPIPIKIR